MPSREAVTRSMVTARALPRGCWSLTTSWSWGRVFSLARIRAVQTSSSAPSASSTVYWNWVRLTRSSTVRSWIGIR